VVANRHPVRRHRQPPEALHSSMPATAHLLLLAHGILSSMFASRKHTATGSRRLRLPRIVGVLTTDDAILWARLQDMHQTCVLIGS
jgi:hypothetical protein